MGNKKQLCTFILDNLFCGLEVQRVQEVLRFRELTAVPLAPPEVKGLINLRGQIVTAIDLRRRFGLDPLPDGRLPMKIVAKAKDGIVSFLVDDIQDVLELDDESFEPPPEPLEARIKDLVQGVYKLDKKLLLLLDADRLLEIDCMADA